MKRLSFFILLSVISFSTRSQTAPADTAKHHKVLLIPYNPMMHLSDADRDMAEFSDKDPEVLRKMFRMGLTRNVNSKIFEVYESHSLLTDYTQAGQKDLDIIYGSIGYAMEDAMAKKDSVQASKSKKKAEEKPKEKYLNVKLSHPELLKMLSEKYGTDIFLFISQLEIKTNYDDCLNLALKIYQRQIKVHFAIFDKSGKQLGGDVAVALYPSNSNDIGQIMSDNFPVVASYIAAAVKQSN